MKNLFDFFNVWQDIEVKNLTDVQLNALKEVLEGGLQEIKNEQSKRK